MKPIKELKIEIEEDEYKETQKNNHLYNRAIPNIEAVAAHFIPDLAILDQKSSLFDKDVIKEHFKHQGKLTYKQFATLVETANNLLIKESNCVKVDRPSYIVGDIHGQFYDLLTILDYVDVSKNSVVFLGDYVDRGVFSTEVYLYLLLLKCHYPKNVTLLRGNHESRAMTTYFTFKKEIEKKYSAEAYELILTSFNSLPICSLIQNKLFCSHGGIPKSITLIESIEKINRFAEVPYSGVICDILWSDPHPNFNNEGVCKSFAPNTNRNCSHFYNYFDLVNFLENNNLTGIIRGHEVQFTGVTLFKDYNNHPAVTTVFSAPNYCDAYLNLGGIVYYDKKIEDLIKFESVAHPFVLAGFSDGITWSLPFVIQLVVELFDLIHHNLGTFSGDWSSSSENEVKSVDSEVKEKIIKEINLLRSERESIAEFVDEESTVTCCQLEIPENEISSFDEAVEKDKVNEEVKDVVDAEIIDEVVDVSPSLLPKTIKSAIDTVSNEIDIDKVEIKTNEADKKQEDSNSEADSMDLSVKKALEDLKLPKKK